MAARRNTKPATISTDFDDWETDPDFIRDIDEEDQRWGAKRTVGSINMSNLIDEVRRDHQTMREKFQHPSQRDYSEGFGGKFGVQKDRKDQSALDYDYHESLSKHSSQEISRKYVTTRSSGDDTKESSESVNERRQKFLDESGRSFQKPTSLRSPPVATKPDFGDKYPFIRTKPAEHVENRSTSSPPRTSSDRVVTEKKTFSRTSESSSHDPRAFPDTFKSIQNKIDAFKKEFEDIENKVSKKSDLSKVIRKTTTTTKNMEKGNDVQYVSRSGNDLSERFNSFRPISSASNDSGDLSRSKIKSLSERFETMCQGDDQDLKRRIEARRKEFFDEIQNQVRETRKGLDGFDNVDDFKSNQAKIISESMSRKNNTSSYETSPRPTTTSPTSATSSQLSSNSRTSSSKPKVYTRRETTEEKVISRIVKENDKVIENETKRNVERSSSCHGSSDEEEAAAATEVAIGSGGGGVCLQSTSIKLIDHGLRSSPVHRTSSPIDELKKRVQTMDTEIKGAGLMARTLYDYQAAEPDELSFDADDLITNIEKIDSGWFQGTITKDGMKKFGLFPANYVKLLNDSANT